MRALTLLKRHAAPLHPHLPSLIITALAASFLLIAGNLWANAASPFGITLFVFLALLLTKLADMLRIAA